ncbi:MAG: peptide chain release factor N(5)-glutamine methyltransferase, partial [Candidatus Omnitrophota bacterium]
LDFGIRGGGMVYFMDFELETGAVAFHPRPETELLVEKAVELLSKKCGRKAPCRIMDIGTGCGSIAISLTKYMPSSRIVATDISDTALRIAGENASKYGQEDRIALVRSNLFASIDRTYYKNFFDLIISNPPYVSLEDLASLSSEAKEDPYIALSGGRDGMDFYRRIIEGAPLFLKENGILLMEMGYNQSESVKTMLEKSGVFQDVEVYRDYSGIDRIIKAVKWKSL